MPYLEQVANPSHVACVSIHVTTLQVRHSMYPRIL
jgi:hypothetical protein